jgi:Tfp pilus assembly protein PilX
MAMIVAMATLMIIALLTAAAVSVAVQTNGSTRRDGNKKKALEAAEAGLQVANYRINMLQPDANHCVGDGSAPVQSPDSTTGACSTSSSVALGNGESYTYSTTPAIGYGTTEPNATCVGLSVTSGQPIAQRCITAVGTANGVTARSQIRVASFAATPLFPIAGMTGIHSITDLQNSTIQGIVASNGPIVDQNGSTVAGVNLGPNASFSNTNQSPAPQVNVLPQPITESAVNVGSSATNTPAGQSCAPASPPATWLPTNCDYRITNGAGLSVCPTSGANVECDPNSGVTFDATHRVLSMRNNATLTLTGGVYNFCEFDAPNNATITIPFGVKTVIYIDSPADPNSGAPGNPASNPACATGTGSLKLSNNVTWTNKSTDPTALQLIVYGDPTNPGANQLVFTNNTAFWGVVFAPNSTLSLSNSSNNSSFWGAITGYTINTSNNYHFNWLASVGTIQGNPQGVYYRTAWAQCRPVPTVSTNPGSGCG